MKKCNICNIEKDETQFFKDASKAGGLQSRCKECSKRPKEYYQKYRSREKSIVAPVKESVQEAPLKAREPSATATSIQKERVKVYIPFLNEYR